MDRSVASLYSGALKPNDPRRFLIEAMLCAMHSDGSVDPREMNVLEKQVANHPLFAGLGQPGARMLIELSTDAIKFAGNANLRAPAIAKGLPARIHRLAAYGMAAEVVVADAQIAEGELGFLEALRLALRISPIEAGQILSYARTHNLKPYLDDRFLRIKNLISVTAEVFALRALAGAKATDDHRFAVRDFFASIPDLTLTKDELDAELYRAFRRPRAPDAEVFGELQRVAIGLVDPVDRYWMVVYCLVAEMPATVMSWRVLPFIGVLQAAFQIGDMDMQLAAADALTFPAAMPRPG